MSIEDRVSNFGSKEWFQIYVSSVVELASRPGRMSQEDAEKVHRNLAKYDPKFSELCKKAHDSACEFMDYVQSKMER